MLSQINSGAPIDLFFSADIRDFDKNEATKTDVANPEKAAASIIAAGYLKPSVCNELVFIVPGNNSLVPKMIEDLKGEE